MELRWTFRLFRHYCIDGNRTSSTADPYVLPHLENPDFDNGLKFWTVDRAEGGNVAVRHFDRFGWLQGRYPETHHGNHFLRMKRSSKGPNRVSQTLKDLDPGRLYSLKMISLDLNNSEKEQKLPISVSLDGPQIIPGLSFQAIYKSSKQCQDEATGRSISSPHFNYHRLVFRPTSRTAELVISDWQSPTEPGGMEDQELACNFIEIQPYYLEP